MNYAAYHSMDELWLTSIPEHWDKRKIKYTFSERVEKGYPDEPLLVASQKMGVVPKGVYGNRTVEATKDFHNLKLVRVGDFVISLRSFQGGLEYAYYQGIISPAYTVMIPTKLISSGYFSFLAKSKLFVELLQMCVTGIREGQNIDYGKLKNHLIPLPPRDEQDQIVRYLNWKVSQINKLINVKRRQIELLREQKQAIVNEAVTKGDDGWNNCRLKDICQLKTGGTPKNNEGINMDNNGQNWVTPSDFNASNIITDAQKSIANAIVQRDGVKLFPKGSILFIGIGGTTGKFALLNCKAYSNQQITAIIPTAINSKFLLYVLMNKSDSIKETANYATLPIVNNTQLGKVEITFPSCDKQQSIVVYLDQQCGFIDKIVDKFNAEITLFTEYRTRLISDVVTGKLDILGVVVPEYEAMEDASIKDDMEAMECAEDLE